MLVSLKKAKHLSFSEVVNSMKYAGKTAASNVFAVKFHKTFASAMSCLVVLLLAIPFSVMGMRVSPLVNLSKAVAFLMIFLVFGVIFTSLGNKGILPSPVAAWGMNILILFPIIKFFRRAM
jgi:lipopolysaccharide export LptBFGC system permease protein LptF